MTCEWGFNTDNKYVFFYRKLQGPSTQGVFGFNNHVDEYWTTLRGPSFPRVIHNQQEDYNSYLRIVLTDVQKEDEGLFYCSVVIRRRKSTSGRKQLIVKGKKEQCYLGEFC